MNKPASVEVRRTKDDRSIDRPFDIAFVILIVIQAAGLSEFAIGYLGVGANSVDASSNPLQQLIWFCIYFAAAIRLLQLKRLSLASFSALWPIWIMCALALLSTMWSLDPGLTFRRAVALSGSALVGVYIGTSLSTPWILKCILTSLTVVLAVSTAFAFADPVVGVDGLRNGWRGIYSTKNELGRIATLGVLIALLLFLTRTARRASLIALALSAAVALASGSALALTVICCLVLALAMTKLYRSSQIATILFICMLGALSPFFYIRFQTLLTDTTSLLGRDATLTGRTDLWMASIQAISQRPLLGYGYQAFWTFGQGIAIQNPVPLRMSAPHAHNGFIDLTLSLGIVGLVAFMLGFVTILSRSLRHLRTNPSREAFVPFMLLMYVIFYNITESSLISRNAISWLLLVVIATKTSYSPVVARDRLPGPAPALSNTGSASPRGAH